MKFNKIAWCLGLVFAASSCFAQMYTIIDLGSLGGGGTTASDINSSGQVAGTSVRTDLLIHAFRTAPNSPINPATDDLGTLGGGWNSEGTAINDSGQVVGRSQAIDGPHSFRTAPNSSIDPANDNLDTLNGDFSHGYAQDINASGQVVGFSSTYVYPDPDHAFRTAPNSRVNPGTDDLGTLGGPAALAFGINDSGQVVGRSQLTSGRWHAFRTAANSPIDRATDDLGTLGGSYSVAAGVNNSGQVVGSSLVIGDTAIHAFRTEAYVPINPGTDDLGTLGGLYSVGFGLDAYGQVVGSSAINESGSVSHAFLHSGGVMHDLNNLIPTGSNWELMEADKINDGGQIIGVERNGGRSFLLIPIYNALVQPPINTDGSSVFKSNRGVLPVKFAVTQYGMQPSCTLPATITVTRASGGTLTTIQQSDADFQITDCLYHYNLATRSLGLGTYRVDISINGIMVGHAVFTLR